MLGGFEVRDEHGQVLPLSVRKAEALLALLALEVGRPVPRDKICGLLWPDVREAQARHSLRQALLSVRKVLPQALHANGLSLTLDASQVSVDVVNVERALELGSREALCEVARAYRGDLLEGASVGEQPFEHWLSYERERIRSAVVRGLTSLIELHSEAGELASAIEACTQLLRLDPLREEIHRTLMKLHLRAGRRGHALLHYQNLTRTLRATLGSEPDADTQKLLLELERPEPTGNERSSQPPSAAVPSVKSSDVVPRPAPQQPELARPAELAALRAARQAALEGRQGCLLVSGEAGVGKTHLSGRLADEVAQSGGRVLHGRCFESEQVLPFSCWVNLLIDAAVASDRELLLALPGECRRELARLLPELPEAAPARAAEDARSLFRALELLLAHLAERGELLVVLEDLHWADEMSLRMLCHLTRRKARSRTAFVLATVRSDEIASNSFLPKAIAELERDHLISRLTVEPFTREQTDALSEQWAEQLGLHTSHASFRDRVWSLSEGNALVIVECAHAYARQAVENDLERLSVPERVRTLVRRRVAQLGGNARELAAFAAVYGRELELDALAGVLDDVQLVAAVEELVEVQLLRALGDRLSFTHDRIRETLYDEMLPARRRLLHGRVAAALERRAAGHELEASALGQVGYHRAKAGDHEAAIPFLTRFSEHARRSHALGDALTALEEALHCATQLTAAKRADAVSKILLRQSFALAFLGRFAELVKKLEEHAGVLELAPPALGGSYHFWWSLGLTLLGRLGEAEDHAARARELASECGDRRMRGYAHTLSAHLSGFAGKSAKSLEHAGTALELLRGEAEILPEAVMFAYVNVTTSQLMLGDWRKAQAVAQEAERFAQASASRRGKAMAALCTGFVLIYLHDWPEALAAARRALEASSTPFTAGPAVTLLAAAQVAVGECAPAIALLEHLTARLDRQGLQAWRGLTAILLAEACLRSGDEQRARELAREASALAGEAGHRLTAGIALLMQGKAALALGEAEDARTSLTAALQLCEGARGSLSTAYTLRAIAELEVAQGQAAKARAALLRAQGIFDAHGLDKPARATAARVAGLQN